MSLFRTRIAQSSATGWTESPAIGRSDTSATAGTEGFNNKIRWLIRQAYGFRDREYLKLKIYQLPEINQEKSL